MLDICTAHAHTAIHLERPEAIAGAKCSLEFLAMTQCCITTVLAIVCRTLSLLSCNITTYPPSLPYAMLHFCSARGREEGPNNVFHVKNDGWRWHNVLQGSHNFGQDCSSHIKKMFGVTTRSGMERISWWFLRGN